MLIGDNGRLLIKPDFGPFGFFTTLPSPKGVAQVLPPQPRHSPLSYLSRGVW